MSTETEVWRLFLAIAVPESLAESLRRFQGKLKKGLGEREAGFRWVPPAGFHVTLSFLGNVGLARLPEIEAGARVAVAAAQAFPLEVRGIGAFPEERAGRVIWAGTQRSRELVALRDEVAERMAALGYPREERDFHPHVTLCRLRNVMSVREWVEPFRRQSFGTFTIRELVLYRSLPKIPYPEYLPVSRFAFGGDQLRSSE